MFFRKIDLFGNIFDNHMRTMTPNLDIMAEYVSNDHDSSLDAKRIKLIACFDHEICGFMVIFGFFSWTNYMCLSNAITFDL